ncbi:DsbA family protein [Azomonas macrocytogenes]|uniref:DSBA-like thioredoxin domain-containing protein n=1 Tax=Azomonas macrocytogenes TaxID=69962 RepID=A0A839T5N8_AZOMA|nr:DsbA family protein [Azomonas macrocytogenes]MBB3104110.1 putative protein-disulfide isomerase [Azomonas macrocytogenes]
MASRLVYVMDPMCSWCWGFTPVLRALLEQTESAGVDLHLVVGGLRSERDILDATGRERIFGYWQAVQAATGQEFDFQNGLPAGFAYDTEPACRALVVARETDTESAWPLAQLIQRAFYCEGRDVTRPAVLVELAARVGLDPKIFARRFDGRLMREATMAEISWAQNLGVTGFPTLLAERNGLLSLLTNGYQPLEKLAPLLGRWLENLAHD